MLALFFVMFDANELDVCNSLYLVGKFATELIISPNKYTNFSAKVLFKAMIFMKSLTRLHKKV